MTGQRYWPELDGVRGLAIIGVLLLHGSYGYFRGGFLGVDLFFSLSGFLITSLLSNEWKQSGSVKLKRFYLKRLLRLYPALVATVLFSYFLWPSLLSHLYWRAAVAALFYHMNLATFTQTPLTHTWSLSIEEQFYLFWPPVLIAILSMRTSVRFALVLIAILSSIAVRLLMLHTGADSFAINRFTFARTDSLLCGCAAALWMAETQTPERTTSDNSSGHIYAVMTLACAVLLSWLFVTADQNNVSLMTWGYTAVAILCAGFVVSAASLPATSLPAIALRSPAIRYLGTRSYGIYLYHFLIFESLEPLRKTHSFINFSIVTCLRVALTLVVAELSFCFLEKPFLALKRHLDLDNTAASGTNLPSKNRATI